MRKGRMILALSMAGVLMTLAACGSGATDTAAEDDGAASAEEAPADTADGDDIKTSDTVFADATIEETELYNADGITVTATGFDANASFGPEITVRVTNETDMLVDVIADGVTVNGYMMDSGLLYVAAQPGETAESVITLYNFVLDACGIDTVATVGLSIVVMEDEPYEMLGSGERVTLTTSAAQDYSQPVDDDGAVLYDTDGILVVSQGLKQDEMWDGDLVLYVENNTDRYIGVTCAEISVNGQREEYTTFWADLYENTRALSGMYLMDIEEPEINSLDDVEEVSFSLQIIDQEDWEQIDAVDVVLTFD